MASAFQVRQACHALRKGGVIIYPTDTIYGIGCDPFDREAVDEVARIKQRPPGKNMILLASDREQLDGVIGPVDDIEMGTTPTTWVMPAGERCPAWLIAADGTVAARLTDHPVVDALCRSLASPIISTSANISGRAPARSGLDMHLQFHGMVDAILIDDRYSTGRASTIRHYSTNKIIRTS